MRPFIPDRLLLRRRKAIAIRESATRARLKSSAIQGHGTFDGSELLRELRHLGITEGTTLFVQCSFNGMHTYSGSPRSVLDVLLEIVGPTGTLLMPAYTQNTYVDPPRSFNVLKEPTYTGLVNELFRRTPGVTRSLHPRHSICGRGQKAGEILSGHEMCFRANGPNSPFDRLRKMPDAMILTLGLPPGYISFLHWVDDYEPERLPFVVHKPTPIMCEVIDESGGASTVSDWQILGDLSANIDYSYIARHLTCGAMKFYSVRGTDIGLYPLDRLSKELIYLRDKGIYHYQ